MKWLVGMLVSLVFVTDGIAQDAMTPDAMVKAVTEDGVSSPWSETLAVEVQ